MDIFLRTDGRKSQVDAALWMCERNLKCGLLKILYTQKRRNITAIIGYIQTSHIIFHV